VRDTSTFKVHTVHITVHRLQKTFAN
jgi:hypothetical protein